MRKSDKLDESARFERKKKQVKCFKTLRKSAENHLKCAKATN